MRFAGSWYSRDAAGVAKEIAAPGPTGSEEVSATTGGVRDGELPVLAVLPHAGLRFSGRGQYAFWSRVDAAAVRSAFDRVVIVAPSHYARIPPDTVVGGGFSGHETPFGVLADAGVAGDVEDRVMIEREHAVELLLPGLAMALGVETGAGGGHGVAPEHAGSRVPDSSAGLPVSALLVGGFSGLQGLQGLQAAGRRIAERMAAAFGADAVSRTLWLVSSDGTHYGPRFHWQPYGAHPWSALSATVREHDTGLVAAGVAAASGKAGLLERYWEMLGEPSTVCGRWALALASAVRGAAVSDARGAGPGAGHAVAPGRNGEGLLTDILDFYSSALVSGRDDGDFVCYVTAVSWLATGGGTP